MSQSSETGERRSWTNLLGLGILILAYVLAISHMLNVQHTQFDPDRIVLRFTHWQLEAGIRDGLDLMARRFEEQYFEDTGQRITLIQQAISERAYRQYIQTHCIGRTAPDLIEIGMFDQDYTRRFFLTNTEDVQRPNPYNQGTPFEHTPWADTYIDGMSGSMDPDTLEYYGAGLATITQRLFYNKQLFREVLGSEDPPKDFRDFLRICEAFRQWAQQTGRPDFVPIAGAQYQLHMFQSFYLHQPLMKFGFEQDQDYNGAFFYSAEVFDRYVAGAFDYDAPPIRAGHDMLRCLTEYFPPGFMALDRMESGFRFTQGKAAFITSGTFDAMSYFTQADFPIGIVQLPLPSRDDPEWGQYFSGPPGESTFWSGLRLGITKFSAHPDIALKFLQFMTTPQNNQDFNRICKWTPLIRTAKSHPSIEAFTPQAEGFWGAGPFAPLYGGRAMMVFNQQLWDFVEHKVSFEDYLQRLRQKLPEAMAVDFERILIDNREQYHVLNAAITWSLAEALFAPTWGLSQEDAALVQSKAERRGKYLWESRPRFLEDSFWRGRWNRYVAEKRPRALEVQSHISLNWDRELP